MEEIWRTIDETRQRLETLAKEGKWNELLNEYRSTTDEKIQIKIVDLAIQNGQKDIVEELIKLGASLNRKDGLGRTALDTAIETNRDIEEFPIVKLLIEKGADISAMGTNGSIPLHTAAYYGQSGIIKYLLEKGADINAKTSYGYTPLMYAITSDDMDVIRTLISKNADVTLQNGVGSNVFHFVAQGESGHDAKDLLELLLQNNPPIEVLNAQDRDGDTPLIIAVKYERMDVANILLEKGVDPNIRDGNGDIALSVVAEAEEMYEDTLEVIDTLIEKGSNINNMSKFGNTILMLAIQNQNYRVASLLVEKGADVTIQRPENKQNALMDLMTIDPADMEDQERLQEDHYDLMKLLIDKGTDLSAKNRTDETAYDIATQSGYSDDILELLNPENTKSKSSGPVWNGFVKSDIDLFHTLFDRPSDISLCPICLEYADRTDGCMYMHHTCRTPRHEKLFQKFQVNGNIEWCTLCGRICNGEHHHYNLSLPTDKDLPSLARVRPTTTGDFRFFDKDCKASGGGGHEEKIKRFNRMLQYACDLQNEVGKMTREEAIQELVEEMWIAASTRNRAVRSMIEKKKFDFPCVFPEGAEVTTRPAEEQPYPDIPRPADEKDLIPIKHEKPDNECVVEIGPHADDRSVFQFQHKQPDGSIYKHEGEYICGEDLEGLIRGKDIDGKCPINPEKCKALLYPEELKGVVSDDFYTSYRNNFNRANAVKKGGSTEGLFRPAENAVCSIEKKKAGRRKTYRKMKKNIKKRRHTYRR